ncbi:MAG: BamA/TamA family outer membrane protein [Myxococcales bacterium]|nr:BamA/TamA family outer membrane protein [Myxococcales bacterium]
MRSRRAGAPRAIALGVALMLGASSAIAAPTSQPTSQPASSPVQHAGRSIQPTSRPVQHTAASVAGAPRPDESSGRRRAPATTTANTLRWIPRVLFFVPRWALTAVFLPMRGLSYLWDRYQIGEQLTDIFFNDERTFGIYPVVEIQTGFGANVGAGMVYRNIFGRDERFAARASFGGRYLQHYAADLVSGKRWLPLHLTLYGGYHVGNNERFYGFGNGDEARIDGVARDALLRGPAFGARYRYDRGTVGVTAALRLMPRVSLRLGTRLTRQTFFDENASVSGDEAIERVFEPQTLVGFERDLANLDSSVELRIDARTRASIYVPPAMYSSGPFLSAKLSYVEGFGPDPSNYVRYLLDASYTFDLFQGTRTLELRLRLEGVSAELERLPFSDAPQLGGGQLLRGYLPGRFRDRVALLGSVQYRFTVTHHVLAYLFVDSGRVYDDISSVSFRQLRVGFGGGLVVHRFIEGFALTAQLAGTPDGDVRFDLQF